MVADFEKLVSLPADMGSLLDASRKEGYDFVERLVTGWNDGSNRFDGDGEVLLGARLDEKLVAVGGLNIDPYLDDQTVGRIRHVYVRSDARGEGVGRELVTVLVDEARHQFRRVRVRAGSPGGNLFYEALGWDRSSQPNATHYLDL